MSRAPVRAFTSEDLDAAASLLAARHERHREACPDLAPIDATAAVEASWDAADGGLVATDDVGTVAGYLLWRLRENDVWGRYAWVDRAEHASVDAEVARDLYAAAAERWVGDGYLKHGVLVPAVADELDPWERLAFARMQVYALRPLTVADEAGAPTLRRSTPEQVDEDVRPFATAIWDHQTATPVFTGLTVPTWDDLRAGWIETLEEPGAVLLVADGDDGPLGHTLFYPADADLGWPAATARFAVAAVHPAHRGKGLGGSLARAVFAEAHAAGFTHVETDWRVTNLEASRTWPRQGFVPVFHRLWRVTGTG